MRNYDGAVGYGYDEKDSNGEDGKGEKNVGEEGEEVGALDSGYGAVVCHLRSMDERIEDGA